MGITMEAGTGKTENKYLDGMGEKCIFAKDKLHLSITIKQACCSAFDLHYLCKKVNKEPMNTTYTTYSLNIPTSDVSLLESLAKKLGWTTKKESNKKTSRLDAAIKASSEEQLYETKDIDDLMDSLMK